jgi:hypothetical protein
MSNVEFQTHAHPNIIEVDFAGLGLSLLYTIWYLVGPNTVR